MIDRPSFEQIYMRLAYDLSRRSTCSRLKVGAVICSPDYRELFAVGYNGGPAGGFNECLSSEPGKCGHIHAEDNASSFAPARVGKVMIVTHFPCPMCCTRMVNKRGFEKVIFSEVYRDTAGGSILEAAGITMEQLSPGEVYPNSWMSATLDQFDLVPVHVDHLHKLDDPLVQQYKDLYNTSKKS